MVDRIKFSPEGLFVSKNGKSTDSGDWRDFVFHPQQQSMIVAKEGDLWFTGSGGQDIYFDNPLQLIPYVIMKSSDGINPNHKTFAAICYPPWNRVRFVVRDGIARTVSYTIFL